MLISSPTSSIFNGEIYLSGVVEGKTESPAGFVPPGVEQELPPWPQGLNGSSAWFWVGHWRVVH